MDNSFDDEPAMDSSIAVMTRPLNSEISQTKKEEKKEEFHYIMIFMNSPASASSPIFLSPSTGSDALGRYAMLTALKRSIYFTQSLF